MHVLDAEEVAAASACMFQADSAGTRSELASQKQSTEVHEVAEGALYESMANCEKDIPIENDGLRNITLKSQNTTTDQGLNTIQ